MSWCKAALTGQQVSAGELIALVNDFEHLFIDLGEPKGMALFEEAVMQSGCSVYFSPGSLPGAENLIASYGGVPCETPDKKNLRYLAGDISALESLS
jgi:hypothetical protein